MPFFLLKYFRKEFFSDICIDEKMGQLINPFKIPHQEKS